MTSLKLYRYETQRYSVCVCPEREIFKTSPAELILREYTVVKETPKGYWITYAFGDMDRWVGKYTKKKFAADTKEEALKDFIERKKAYVRHAENTLKRAKEDLYLGQQKLEER